ncbi:flagellar biosynthetic protein FliO [Caloranaerobacter sp. TR13]|uniref:flagellar biosynthetic protein FliO n=1 Tax=Caloranaerobacter sp. TR13 TaxID=1302151 RepID=UPI00128CA860|nr:flagellar biosynthetic protein FliO [Caloranaerobacter sp. TR13]
MNFKLNSVGRKHRIKIIDVLNISGIKILILEIYDKYYVLAYNNNSITLIDELDNIELLEFNDSITNKSSFNKYLEKFFMKNDFKNKSKD